MSPYVSAVSSRRQQILSSMFQAADAQPDRPTSSAAYVLSASRRSNSNPLIQPSSSSVHLAHTSSSPRQSRESTSANDQHPFHCCCAVIQVLEGQARPSYSPTTLPAKASFLPSGKANPIYPREPWAPNRGRILTRRKPAAVRLAQFTVAVVRSSPFCQEITSPDGHAYAAGDVSLPLYQVPLDSTCWIDNMPCVHHCPSIDLPSFTAAEAGRGMFPSFERFPQVAPGIHPFHPVTLRHLSIQPSPLNPLGHADG
ncbi:hypothetical protein CI238_06928 [Colletotrichum incanum]|uniref:Uncharacterized protein n=1 Tax=Colletotrichum incanum TaxID=1573173 RepID=A0A161YD19_COLIC|nr:hypothetical protein CI238_06928 [Colletotrichum incanum]